MTIFYFSGTGNSLALAQQLGSRFPDSRVYNIADYSGSPVNDRAVGFVFPVYCHRPPEIVTSFLDKIDLPENAYLFAVATYNGLDGETGAVFKRQLSKRGLTLNAYFKVLMPGNSVILLDKTSPPEVREQRLADSSFRIQEIVTAVTRKESSFQSEPYKLKNRLMGIFLRWYLKRYRLPSRFHVDAKCNGCGACASRCPENLISIQNGIPQWKNSRQCQACLACFHRCPGKAVQIGDYTESSNRYSHPVLT